jgi:hypothetical protein
MNRKEFLVQITGYGALGAGLAKMALAPCCAAAQSLSAAQTKPEVGTPIEKRMSWEHIWVKRFFDNLDAQVDEPTRTRLMHANGRSCYRGAVDPPKNNNTPKEFTMQQFPGTLDEFITLINKYSGPTPAARREGNIVYFDYVANPWGLKNEDGWCLCPLIEQGPEGISGTFCECSVGYVTEMFTDIAHQPVQVELLESLKRGGKRCRFKIQLSVKS